MSGVFIDRYGLLRSWVICAVGFALIAAIVGVAIWFDHRDQMACAAKGGVIRPTGRQYPVTTVVNNMPITSWYDETACFSASVASAP